MIITDKKVTLNQTTFIPDVSATVTISAEVLQEFRIYNEEITKDLYYIFGKRIIDEFIEELK